MHPLIQYWHAEDTPGYIEELFAGVRLHNPDLRQMLFNEQTATTLIDTHLTAREVAAFRSCAVPAMQSDYFRYCAAYALGGVYCDADFRCLGPLTSLLDAEAVLFEAKGSGMLNNSLFGFRAPGHPLLGLSIDIATEGIEARLCENVPTVTGPVIFTGLAMIWRFGLDGFVEVMEDWHSLISVKREVWLRALALIQEVVGDYARVADAFDGVWLAPYNGSSRALVSGAPKLAYKSTGDHYPNWKGTIYRSSSS